MENKCEKVDNSKNLKVYWSHKTALAFGNFHHKCQWFLKKIQTKQKMPLIRKKKQEAHGPHRSPEKTVQINKHI